MVRIGRMASAGYDSINQAKTSGKWYDAYSSNVAPNIPNDLEEALKKSAALTVFEGFSNSMKLQYTYWVESAKIIETRRQRIDRVITKTKAMRSQ